MENNWGFGGSAACPSTLGKEAHRLNLDKVANSPKASERAGFVCCGHQRPAISQRELGVRSGSPRWAPEGELGTLAPLCRHAAGSLEIVTLLRVNWNFQNLSFLCHPRENNVFVQVRWVVKSFCLPSESCSGLETSSTWRAVTWKLRGGPQQEVMAATPYHLPLQELGSTSHAAGSRALAIKWRGTPVSPVRCMAIQFPYGLAAAFPNFRWRCVSENVCFVAFMFMLKLLQEGKKTPNLKKPLVIMFLDQF